MALVVTGASYIALPEGLYIVISSIYVSCAITGSIQKCGVSAHYASNFKKKYRKTPRSFDQGKRGLLPSVF